MFKLIVSDSKDIYSLKDNFLPCRCVLYITINPPPFLFFLLWMSMLYPAVSRLAFIYWYSGSLACCVHVSLTTHMSMLLSYMWCMIISNLGLRDCMLTNAMLSLVGFQKVLWDLFSGHNKLWWVPLLLSKILEYVFFPPLFLLKFHFIFKFLYDYMCQWLFLLCLLLVYG